MEQLSEKFWFANAQSPVVFFPNDDAFWFSGVAESIMRIYEKDRDAEIGAVSAAESLELPMSLSGKQKWPEYQMELRDTTAPAVNKITGFHREKIFSGPPLLMWKTANGKSELPWSPKRKPFSAVR